MPEHRNPSSPERTAVAPFNFVPLPAAVLISPEQKPPDYNRYDPNRYSGVIALTITAETPLYIRGGQGKDFFHHGKPSHPVIPGSSLRGMTRTLVEIISHGKMQWFSDKQLVFRAVGDNSSLGNSYRERLLGPEIALAGGWQGYDYPSLNVHGGYLETTPSGGYAIRPALRFEDESFVHVEYADAKTAGISAGIRNIHTLYVEPVVRTPTTQRGRARIGLRLAVTPKVSSSPEPELQPAKLVVSGHMGNLAYPRAHDKHMHCAVYEPDPVATLLPIDGELWNRYEEDADMKRGAGTPTRKIRPGEPLFYLLDSAGKVVFFGPTMMFRLPYTQPVSAFVPSQLRDNTQTDLAEAIFGTVQKNTGGTTVTIRSRVVFEDAVWKSGEGFYGDKSPKILGTPKATAFQEYLVQDKPDHKPSLRHYGDSPNNTRIRGHKLYWHKQFSSAKYWERNPMPDSPQHTVIRPVRPGSQFEGQVRFENLSTLELGALLAALELPETRRHKLGMGKPLGMGSVRIAAQVNLIDRRQRYSRLFDDAGCLETGPKPDTAPDGSSILNSVKDAFRQAVIAHHNTHSGRQARLPLTADFWQIPRLAELAKLLEWVPNRNDARFDYPPPSPNGGIDGHYWRQRRVLPTPRGV